MVKKIILSVIIIFIFSSVFVYAGGIPSYDDFDDGDVSAYAVDMSDNESADTYYVNGENGRLAIHMGGGAYYWIRIQKEFTPVVTGTLIAEFSLFLPEGSYMLNYRGFPIFADLDGNEIGMVKIWGSGGSDVKINDVPIENFRFEPGKEYRCKIELDLDRGMFRFFVDDGAGYIQKFTQDNKNEFAYGGRGVKKIMFSCETYPDSPNLIYLDDIYIHMNERYVYVSPEGSDQNDGSFKNPFATAQRALEEKDAVIMFLKGTHILGDSFTYGPVDLNETPNARVMMPMYEEGIYVDGDFKTE